MLLFVFGTRLMFYAPLLAVWLWLSFTHLPRLLQELSHSYPPWATFLTPSCLPKFLPFGLPDVACYSFTICPDTVLLPPIQAICCIFWGTCDIFLVSTMSQQSALLAPEISLGKRLWLSLDESTTSWYSGLRTANMGLELWPLFDAVIVLGLLEIQWL